ncbi:MAG: hydrogenase expression/formation protein HypE [Lacisediminihabitans sp.]
MTSPEASVRGKNRLNDSEEQVLERIESFRRRRPRLIDETVTLAHGAGGKASAALVDAVFVEAFGNPTLNEMGDGAVIELPAGRVAFSTDSYVVNPLFFPGGSIGDLAVNGTVNDLAVSGARPGWLSAAFVIEEGLPVATLREIAADMRAAADRAGVSIVTGDTKVVPKGAADRVFITTAGIGVIPDGRQLGAQLVQPGDRVLVSGSIGDHGMAVMMARGDLAIEAEIRSDSASVSGMVEALLERVPDTRWMRDATRGGLGTVANELAQASGLGVVLDEDTLPVKPMVRGACDMLGIDPLYVANEGCFVAIVPADQAEQALEAVRSLPGGSDAALIGEIVAYPAEIVAVRTAFGGTRIVDMLVGDPLPRIC